MFRIIHAQILPSVLDLVWAIYAGTCCVDYTSLELPEIHLLLPPLSAGIKRLCHHTEHSLKIFKNMFFRMNTRLRIPNISFMQKTSSLMFWRKSPYLPRSVGCLLVLLHNVGSGTRGVHKPHQVQKFICLPSGRFSQTISPDDNRILL
jgi:hypothetical protein